MVGTFNDWEPGLHELKQRRDGTRTVSVPLDPGHYRFRYLASDGVWLDDEHADAVGPQGSELRALGRCRSQLAAAGNALP